MKQIILTLIFVALWSGLYGVSMSPELKDRLIKENRFDEVVDILKDAEAVGFDAPNPAPFRPTRGRVDTVKAVAILVDFSDNVGTASVAHFDSMLASCGCYPTGSMRDYYLEVSYGAVEMITTVVGWFRLPQVYTYYTNNNYGFGGYPMNAQRMTEDAVWAADPTVDFSQFDNDNDGYIDALFIIHAGPGAEVTGNLNDIWSHASTTVNVPYVDGVYAFRYSTEPEDGRIGVFSHEAGHAIFGLPDLYDYDYDSEGVGNWSLMASGSWNMNGFSPAHPDAYCRIDAGFLDPIVVTSNQDDVVIPNVNNNQVIYKLWKDGIPGTEYFLVENRTYSGFDSYLPWSGLLIYHVDETMPHNNWQWYPGHTSYGHYKVALEQSDGLWQMEQNINTGNYGDPYPGAMPPHYAFNDTTLPDSKDYNFTTTNVAVENVSIPGDTMTADFRVFPVAVDEVTVATPVRARLQVLPAVGRGVFQISYTVTVDPELARIDIYDVAGRMVNSFKRLSGETVVWNGNNFDGTPVSGGAYFVMLHSGGSAEEQSEIQKIVFIR